MAPRFPRRFGLGSLLVLIGVLAVPLSYFGGEVAGRLQMRSPGQTWVQRFGYTPFLEFKCLSKKYARDLEFRLDAEAIREAALGILEGTNKDAIAGLITAEFTDIRLSENTVRLRYEIGYWYRHYLDVGGLKYRDDFDDVQALGRNDTVHAALSIAAKAFAESDPSIVACFTHTDLLDRLERHRAASRSDKSHNRR